MWQHDRLIEFEQTNGPATIAIVGAGYVGTGVIHALERSPGMRPALVVNRTPETAVAAFVALGYGQNDIVVSDTMAELETAISRGVPAVTTQTSALTSLPIDLVVEATGAIDYGAETILSVLESGRSVVSFNAECDALLGGVFSDRARANGAVYTIADGDQPGVLFRLRDDVAAMGFEVTAMINCKRHLDVHQTPSTGAGYTSRDATSAKMTTAFGDGTKMQIEQAVVSNATGLSPDRRGMHGVKSMLETAATDIGSLLGNRGRVDYTLGGDFGAGVGVLGHHPDHALHERAMRLYKMGDGPNYFFFRAFHLVHLEVPRTIADVVLDQRPLAEVRGPRTAEVISLAKSDLDAGTDLDGIGGFCAYGVIDTLENASGLLPVALSEFATLESPVRSDEPIPLDAVSLDTSRTVVKEWLRSLESDTLLGSDHES